jgi:hypothetical protein
MKTDVRAPAHLCALPNDILRAMATFMPPSALLVMVRCSRRFSRVLHGEMTQRLDGLFQYVALPTCTASFSTLPDCVKLVEHSWPQHMPRLSVEAMLGTSDLHPGGYLFLEALKGYDGPQEHSGLFYQGSCIRRIYARNHKVLRRFEGWLNFRKRTRRMH